MIKSSLAQGGGKCGLSPMKKCGKNAEKCGKNAEKCGKMRKNAENAEKCGLKYWDLEKSPICPDSGQGMGKKNPKSQTKKNTAEKISHQLWPISMKIGPNNILRGHFGHFLPFI